MKNVTTGTQLSVVIWESMAGVNLAHSACINIVTPNVITMKEEWEKTSGSLTMKKRQPSNYKRANDIVA